MTELAPGARICDCTLICRCGAGAYGEVWLADDEVGTRVAVKIVPNGGRYSEREIRGLRNYRDIDHPNLLRIRHIGITPEFLCCAMDAADDLRRGESGYVPDTLANRLREFRRMDGAEIAEMLDGLLAGLSELHRRGLVHRDIKPDNILWVKGRPTLADTGLIAPAGRGSLVGTPGFLSPRLLAGKSSAEPEDDFYALGKVIYCALTGNPVEEYPSIPSDLTLSGNADWNRLFRSVCEAPVRSAEDFRKKMRFQTEEKHRRCRIRYGALLLLIPAGLAVAFFFILPHIRRMHSAPAPAEITPAAEVSVPESVPEPDIKWNDSASPVLAALRAEGLYDSGCKDELLNLPWISRNEFFSRIEKCGQNPRMSGFPRYFADKKASPLEKELSEICRDYRESDPGDLEARQFRWRTVRGDALAVQRAMLADDPVMQTAALDYLIYRKIDDILSSGGIGESDKTGLQTLIKLKNSLLPLQPLPEQR